MNNDHRDIAMEQQYADRVIAQITERLDKLREQSLTQKTHVVEIKKYFWDDVTVNTENIDDLIETVASMRQQAAVLAEQERHHRQSSNELGQLTKLQKSPFFGRIDFTEQGSAKTETIYIGLASFRDDSGEQYLVYDWRAPVSSLYYDYAPGPAAYETPSGTIHGTMELKRQYTIRDGRIHYMFDAGVTIGDELLRQVLGQSSDAHMRNIVSTIQKEQNQIIRNDRSRMLIVQGAAGSGKTSAALQRVAYLLYKYRGSLQADQIVLFSPNPMFNSYISTVLPELGEENMQQTTFQQFLDHHLGKQFQLEDPFEQMEYLLADGEDRERPIRSSGIRFKASVTFLQAIERYKDSLVLGGMRFKDLRFRGRVLISGEQIAEQFYSAYPDVKLHNRIGLLGKWLLKELDGYAKLERRKSWVQDEMQLLDSEQYQQAFNDLQHKRRNSEETFDDYKRENDLLCKMIVNEHFKPLRRRVKRLTYIDISAIYRQLFADPATISEFVPDRELPDQWTEICESTMRRLQRKQLPYEDATPLLYLKQLIEGFQTNTSVRHVFVDEAQDYSPFQFEFVKRLFPRSKMTVLGDLNQAIFAHASELKELTDLRSLYGPEETVEIQLTRSYRSTREIVQFTKSMMPNGDLIVPFNRPGDLPVVSVCPNRTRLHDAICETLREARQDGSAAIICKTAQEARNAYEQLKGELDMKLVTKETAEFEKGVVVIPVYLAKGVEFDTVIVYDASAVRYGKEEERKLLYTACTRAMHKLYVFALSGLSPILAEIAPNLYRTK